MFAAVVALWHHATVLPVVHAVDPLGVPLALSGLHVHRPHVFVWLVILPTAHSNDVLPRQFGQLDTRRLLSTGTIGFYRAFCRFKLHSPQGESPQPSEHDGESPAAGQRARLPGTVQWPAHVGLARTQHLVLREPRVIRTLTRPFEIATPHTTLQNRLRLIT